MRSRPQALLGASRNRLTPLHLQACPESYGLAYIDYGQQEFAIQAVRSMDPEMLAAYRSGDPYTFYPQRAGYTHEQALICPDHSAGTQGSPPPPYGLRPEDVRPAFGLALYGSATYCPCPLFS